MFFNTEKRNTKINQKKLQQREQKPAHETGTEIEAIAKAFLEEQGLTILEQNFHCKFGEIDLIAKHNNKVIFVEVRYRKNSSYGSGANSVTTKKQQKIIATAKYYTTKISSRHDFRFDIISVSASNNTYKQNDLFQDVRPEQQDSLPFKRVNIQWIKNAFLT